MLISRFLSDGFPFPMDEDISTGGEGETDPPAPQGIPDDTSGPDGTPAGEQSDVDYEQRYNDLRPEFDRRSQELSQREQFQEALSGQAGPEAQREAFKSLNIELEDDADPEDEYDDDPDSRLERIEETLQQRDLQEEQAQMVAAENNFLTEGIEVLEEKENREFSEDEIAVLASVARANRTDSGAPDLALAYDHLSALVDQRQQEWVESKKTQRRPGAGTAATEAVDLSDPDARVRLMAEQMSALEAEE